MVTDNSNPPAGIRFAIPVLKDELRCFPTGTELDYVGSGPVMVSGEHDDFATIAKAIQKCLRGRNRSAIMDQVAGGDGTELEEFEAELAADADAVAAGGNGSEP